MICGSGFVILLRYYHRFVLSFSSRVAFVPTLWLFNENSTTGWTSVDHLRSHYETQGSRNVYCCTARQLMDIVGSLLLWHSSLTPLVHYCCETAHWRHWFNADIAFA